MQLNEIHLGPIRHESLPEDLMRPLRWTYRHMGHFHCETFEQWEIGFMRDTNPINEIALWVKMTWAALEFVKTRAGRTVRQAYGELLAAQEITVGSSDKPRRIRFKSPGLLSKNELRALLQLIENVPDYLADPNHEIFDT